MKNIIRTLTAVGAFGAATLIAHAQQPAPRIATVDVEKVYNSHYETLAQQAQLNVDKQKAQDQINQLIKEGNAMIAQLKELQDQASNPAASAEAKAKANSDGQALMKSIQDKQNDINNLGQSATQLFTERIKTFRAAMIDEISKVVLDVAKRHSANMVIDKSSIDALGVPVLLSSDPAYDITDEVMAEINKNKPPASAAAPATDAAPKITVPGAAAPGK